MQNCNSSDGTLHEISQNVLGEVTVLGYNTKYFLKNVFEILPKNTF